MVMDGMMNPMKQEHSVDIGDVNGDGEYNVLDIVSLAYCVINDLCG